MTTDDDVVVFNKKTRNFVGFKLDSRTGEVIITSGELEDTDTNCIVTTWKNIYVENLEKKSGKRR